MPRGYIRKVPGHSAPEQELAHFKAGSDPIYRDEQLGFAVRGLRRGDELAVAGTLRILANNRDGIAEVVDRVHKQGAAIVDIVNDRRTDRDGVAMMADAIRELANERRKGLDGKLGAKARWGTPKRMPKLEARKIWENAALTTAQAIDKMDGWTVGTAYRLLGKRGAPAGRR